MASSSSGRKGSRQMPLKDRRAAPGAKGSGSLRKLKGLLGRPIGLERREGKLHVVLTERRRQRPADESPSMSQLCAELSARLLAHEASEVQTMRHLILVHDALERRGWTAIEGMSALVLAKAIEQAEALAAEEPSPLMDMLIEGSAAAAHRGRPARPARDAAAGLSSRRQPRGVGVRLCGFRGRRDQLDRHRARTAWCRRATATTDRARRGESLIATGAAPSATLPPLHSGGVCALLPLAASCAARGAGLRRLVRGSARPWRRTIPPTARASMTTWRA